MDEASREVLMTYARLNLPHMVFRTLLGTRPFLAVTIVGQMGVGKSSYAYYSLKTGIMAYLCHPAGINLFKEADRCIAYLESIHGELCMSKHCPKPDALDKRYALDIYTGPQGLFNLIETAAELAESGSPKRRILFLDDIVARTGYTLGGELRKAYFAFREILRLSRSFSSVVVVTAPTKEFLPPEAIRETEFIVGNYGYNMRRFWRMVPFFLKDEEGRVRRGLKFKFSDDVPAKSAFGMPKWLDDEIAKRKRQSVAKIAEMVVGRKPRAKASESLAAPQLQADGDGEKPQVRSSRRAEHLAERAIEICKKSGDFAAFKACIEAAVRNDEEALAAAKRKVFAALSNKGKPVMRWEDVAKVEGPPSAYL